MKEHISLEDLADKRQIGSMLEQFYKKYPNCKLYVIGVHDTGGMHTGSNKLSKQRFYSQAIHSSINNGGIVVKGNPWKHRDYYCMPNPTPNQRIKVYVPEHELAEHYKERASEDYVFLAYSQAEFEAIEIEFNPINNKEASISLKSFEEE